MMKPQAALRIAADIFVEALKCGDQARAVHVVKFGLPADARVVNVFHDRGTDGRRELVIIVEAAAFSADALTHERFMGWPILCPPWLQVAYPNGDGLRAS